MAWNGKGLINISSKLKVPLYNEENDVPNDPSPYGIIGWHQNDSFIYMYDRYDVWRLDPTGNQAPVNLTGNGRTKKQVYRYVKLNPEERFFVKGQTINFRVQHEQNKKVALYQGVLGDKMILKPVEDFSENNYNFMAAAKAAPTLLYTKESYTSSPDLIIDNKETKIRLTKLNEQQSAYNWGTAELFTWKTFNGKESKGILYKPENFDPTKKYPMIIYFYEKLSDGLYSYNAPGPTPSRLNIPFYTSRGYLVFTPDITYTKGHPAKDAYNFIVSGAQALMKNKWVDAKNIGIQGQSWGGYQVMALITQTNMFKAAWAGAPVVNMTSAYGGIRWESGNNRQFQYEKGQSRIGATLWENPALYIENSPLFHLHKVNTPVVIMANDADGAVPWYQGIETFTALRRLNKPVWMLNYNGEAHNLVERKNRKDIQIRQQQYFDWLLKGEKPAKWIVEGIPAVKKGKDWGLGIAD
jgi:dipeptidyl aminopeptidase/acylaminoacyl peptidase